MENLTDMQILALAVYILVGVIHSAGVVALAEEESDALHPEFRWWVLPFTTVLWPFFIIASLLMGDSDG
jgi:hypothetical protein